MEGVVTRRVFFAIVGTSLFWFFAGTLYFVLTSPSNYLKTGQSGRSSRLMSRLEEGKEIQPAQLGPQDDVAKQLGYTRHGFNQLLSSRIALDRAVPDARDPMCKTKSYPANMPSASVVVIFHNEAFSTLLRTVHSVLNRSPPELIHEIVLFDDCSSYEDMQERLETYIKSLPKVKLVRSKKRQGLIRARLGGAAAATGEILVFLDSHCEANVGWLEPLIERIHQDRTRVVCPVIDTIDLDTFRYEGSPPLVRGGFSWQLHFKWRPIPKYELARRSDATTEIRSPTMAGGLFALNRGYFKEIGSYDHEMDIWGGENLELSFRVWQCGGALEIIPCSRVGHVFRKRQPYTFPGGAGNILAKNSIRVAEVWLDDYKKFYYATQPDLKGINYGNVTGRVELRKRLNCKPFQWFLDNVYPELPIPDKDVIAWGELRNPDSALCLDTLSREDGSVVGIFFCHGGGGNQGFSLTKEQEVRHDENCLDAARHGDEVKMLDCHGLGGNQRWEYTEKHTLVHFTTRQCLDRGMAESGGNIRVANCNGGPSQIWEFSKFQQGNKTEKINKS